MDVDEDDSVTEGVAAVLGRTRPAGCRGRRRRVGTGRPGGADARSAEARDQLETNFWGAVRLVQAALPIMRRQGGGRIVLVSSIGGVVGIPFQAFYSASKFALEGYGEALAYEVTPFGIHVTLVQPGNSADRLRGQPAPT